MPTLKLTDLIQARAEIFDIANVLSNDGPAVMKQLRDIRKTLNRVGL